MLLLVPSATYRAADFLAAARRLHVEVVVGCDQPPVLGDRTLTVALDDPEAAAAAIVELDRRLPLDAVVAVDDRGAVAAAAACARLGLAANPPEAVAATRDKLRLRHRLDRAEVPQPAFAALPADAGPEAAAAAAGGLGFPVVVKPVSLSASQGVIRADDPDALARALTRVRAIAAAAGRPPAEPLLIERFVPGPEVAVEALLGEGRLTVLAVFDKPDPLDGPYFEETIYVTPSRLPAADLQAVTAATEAATAALGLVHGPVHAELRVSGGRAQVIEVAARTIGGLCGRALRFGTGRSLEELVLAQAVGSGATRTDTAGAAGVMMLPVPRAGRLRAVHGREAALAVPGVVDLEVAVAPGRPVVPVPEGDRYLGFLFARGPDPAAVEASLRAGWARLEVVVDADATVTTC